MDGRKKMSSPIHQNMVFVSFIHSPISYSHSTSVQCSHTANTSVYPSQWRLNDSTMMHDCFNSMLRDYIGQTHEKRCCTISSTIFVCASFFSSSSNSIALFVSEIAKLWSNISSLIQTKSHKSMSIKRNIKMNPTAKFNVVYLE